MLVDGKSLAKEVLNNTPNLSGKRVCFLVLNSSEAGRSFVSIKKSTAEQCGITVDVVEEKVLSTEEALECVSKMVGAGYDGLVVQLPLGDGVDTDTVLNAIPLELDIDLLSRRAKDAYARGETKRLPPVAGAVQEILRAHNVSTENKRVIVLGKGRLVGEPVMMLFDRLGVEYDALDKFTPYEELLERIRQADIVVSGIGVPHFIKPDMIKIGAVLIDAGTSVDMGKTVGDVDPVCEGVASLMTPVPGGVGPLTVACLLSNLAVIE